MEYDELRSLNQLIADLFRALTLEQVESTECWRNSPQHFISDPGTKFTSSMSNPESPSASAP